MVCLINLQCMLTRLLGVTPIIVSLVPIGACQCCFLCQKNWHQTEPIKCQCTTFFVWHCGFLACMWQFPGLRDLVNQGDY